jgi:hypothetical protein
MEGDSMQRLTMIKMAAALLFATAALVAACGDGGMTLPDPGPDAGVDRSQTLGGASAAQLGLFCDWNAGRLGGYGRSATCGGVTVRSPAGGRSECVTTLQQIPASCPVTIGEFQDCVNAIVMGPCTAGAVPQQCVSLFVCAMF